MPEGDGLVLNNHPYQGNYLLLQDDLQQRTKHTEPLPHQAITLERSRSNYKELCNKAAIIQDDLDIVMIQDTNAGWMIFLICGYTVTTPTIEQWMKVDMVW